MCLIICVQLDFISVNCARWMLSVNCVTQLDLFQLTSLVAALLLKRSRNIHIILIRSLVFSPLNSRKCLMAIHLFIFLLTAGFTSWWSTIPFTLLIRPYRIDIFVYSSDKPSVALLKLTCGTQDSDHNIQYARLVLCQV